MMSLVRAWLYGIGAFIAVSAAFCVALAYALAGPPTASEAAGLRDASATAMRDLGGAVRRFGASLCDRLPIAHCELEAQTPHARMHAPLEHQAHQPLVAEEIPSPQSTPIVAHEPVAIDTSPHAVASAVVQRTHPARRRAPPPSARRTTNAHGAQHPARRQGRTPHQVLAGGARHTPPITHPPAAQARAVAPHTAPRAPLPQPQAQPAVSHPSAETATHDSAPATAPTPQQIEPALVQHESVPEPQAALPRAQANDGQPASEDETSDQPGPAPAEEKL